MYKSKRYAARPLEAVFADVDTAKAMWLDATRVFLADGDALALPTGHLVSILERLAETSDGYPAWLAEMLSGRHRKPRQRGFFLEEVHRDAIWSCFHLPVSGTLLGHWMNAKFDELLCIGLQILKNSRTLTDRDPIDLDQPCGEKIRRARAILGMEYANPPALGVLARQLGLSETRLKSGFKSMNGTTVMQYCLDKRIEAGAVMVGDPEDCLRVAKVYESAGVDLLLMLVQVGAVPHEKVMQTIDLIGKHVMPKLSQSAKAFQQQSAAAR